MPDRYDRTTWTWSGGTGRVIGTGFVPGSAFVRIAAGANGWLYLVRPDGALVLYRHTGWQNGRATWADPHGTVASPEAAQRQVWLTQCQWWWVGPLLVPSPEQP